MSELYVTTTGRYGMQSGVATSTSNPVPPTVEPGWTFSLAGSAAADGVLFWFWRVDPPIEGVMEICHHGQQDEKGRVFVRCGDGNPHQWGEGESWTTETVKVTCEPCIKSWEEAEAKSP